MTEPAKAKWLSEGLVRCGKADRQPAESVPVPVPVPFGIPGERTLIMFTYSYFLTLPTALAVIQTLIKHLSRVANYK